MKEDLIIEVHKFAKKKILTAEPTNLTEVFNALKNAGFSKHLEKVYSNNPKSVRFEKLLKSIFECPGRSDLYHKQPNFRGGRNNDEYEIFIKLEAYFRLLEYEELKEARESSKFAKWTAIIAIIISIIGTGVNIYFSKKSLDSPTKINENQFKKIEKLLNPP